jgi:cell division transport system permease protein
VNRAWTFLKRALANVALSPFQNAITIGVIVVSIAILGVYLLFLRNAHAAMERWRGDLAILLYLDDDVGDAARQALVEAARSVPEVERVRYVSKDAALAAFLRDVPGYRDLFTGLGANPLPASLELAMRPAHRDVATVERVARVFEGRPGVQEVYYGKDWIRRLERIVRLASTAGAAVGLFLLIGAVFLITNTIHLTITARRAEIEVQRLVGASDAYIYAPFLIEGMLQGLAGSGIALGLVALGHGVALGALGAEASILLGSVRPVFLPAGWMVALAAGGMLLGVIGSLISIARFAKV